MTSPSPDVIDVDAIPRAEVRAERQHTKYLLKELSFTQQFSHMYYGRLNQLTPKAEAVVRSDASFRSLKHHRVLQLKVGERALVIGTLYKQLSSVTSFLREYTKELVKLVEGAEEDDGEAVDDDDDGTDAVVDEDNAPTGSVVSLVSESDTLILEDDSGRVEVVVSSLIKPAEFVTGVVLGLVGILEAKGKFSCEAIVLPKAPAAMPRSLPTNASHVPCYVAFLGGLDMDATGSTGLAAALLVDYLSGNLGNESTVAEAARIARVVVGGNLVAPTEDSKLKHKIRLEPGDHTKPNFNRSASTSANAMRHADALLRRLAASVDVDVMPGENDPTNAFFPQQPMHPVLLKSSSRIAQLKLVTNPFEFALTTDSCSDATHCIVTSGQNVTDVVEQTNLPPLACMAASLDWSLLCPTAPNTLPCYPFKDMDPFIIDRRPHLYVACNQETFETTLVPPPNTTAPGHATRLVCVPSFRKTGRIVLVDLNSPTLDVKTVCFAVGNSGTD